VKACGGCGGPAVHLKGHARGSYECLNKCWWCPWCAKHFLAADECNCEPCQKCGHRAYWACECPNITPEEIEAIRADPLSDDVPF
jgi:hypothetical protein